MKTVASSYVSFQTGIIFYGPNRNEGGADLKIIHQPVRPKQSGGGQTADSWTITGNTQNKYLYNAGSELNNTTGNYQTYFRDYA